MDQSNVIPMTALPVVSITKERVTTTSLDVAEVFEKRHDNVIQAIEMLEIPEGFRRLNFQETLKSVSLPNNATRQDKMYVITRDGFTLLCMGFTGKKAMQFKLAYIEAFNKMEAELQRRRYNPSRIAWDIQRMLPPGFVCMTRGEWKTERMYERRTGAIVSQSLSTKQKGLMYKAIEYRQKGLTYIEIAKLLDTRPDIIERVLGKAFLMGKDVRP